MKVSILHASAGQGHKRAADALAKAFRSERRDSVVSVQDVLDFTPLVFRKTYAEGYLRIVRRVPELWGYMYSQTDRKSVLPWRRKVRSAFNKVNARRFLRFCDEFEPDIVVCTHFMPLEVLSHRGRGRCGSAPLFCCVTDFAVHSLWITENVDGYYVATDEGKRQLVRRGQRADRVVVSGIPIDPVFATSEPKAVARRRLGLNPTLSTVLVLSGGFGVGPTTNLVRAFRETPIDGQIIVVAGANEKLRRQAQAEASRSRTPTVVYGFVNNIHEMMDAADLVITKPGGLTSSEVLAKGIPMMIVDPIPGQEQRNCEYLLEAGAAVRLFDIEDAPHKVNRLLRDRSLLAEMRTRAVRTGRPDAAVTIVRDIVRRTV